VRALDQGVRVLILLDLLAAIRKCKHEFVIVTVDLTPNLVQ
jgi:hypothetical protein